MIFKSLAFVSLLGFSFSAHALETGFSAGNEFRDVSLVGSVSVFCNPPQGGGGNASFACSGGTLDPVEASRFVVTPAVDADKVKLTAHHEDGSTRSKDSAFDAKNSRSRDFFNLWIETLFQRPLLDPGKNEITYELTNKGKLVARGVFTAWVRPGKTRDCGHDSVFSSDAMDCRIGNHVCENLFIDRNYCQ